MLDVSFVAVDPKAVVSCSRWHTLIVGLIHGMRIAGGRASADAFLMAPVSPYERAERRCTQRAVVVAQR